MSINIEHLPEKHRFQAIVDGYECVIDYHQTADKSVLDYYHTFVSPELRGRHIAEELAIYALSYARQNHFKIIPTCPYIKVFIERHPEYQDLVK